VAPVIASVVAALTLVGAQAAQANSSGSITQYLNSSDPELIQCPNSNNTGMTLCLFASMDMGNVSIPYGQNYYPMKQTGFWRLQDNTSASDPTNWVWQGAQINESTLYNRNLGVPTNAYHLWAPGVRYLNGTYYLYVPDVMDVNDESYSSRLYLFTTTSYYGAQGWTYRGPVDAGGAGPNGLYASDPQVAVAFDGNDYLYFANGDNSNCGGLSQGVIDFSHLNNLRNAARVQINGFASSGLGTCGIWDHPYLEGPAMYTWLEVGAPAWVPWDYMLMFAAKPNAGAPAGCSTDNEVIAYATSWSPTGPWDYQGIIMCGSTSEWTNQASIVKHTANNGKYLFAWHDGGPPNHNRRSHLSCVVWGDDGKIVEVPRLDWNLGNCP